MTGFGFPFGCVAAVAAVMLAVFAGATRYPWYALVTLGAVVLVVAVRTSFTEAAGVAVVAWALHDGFVLGRAGELRFDWPSAVAAGVLGLVLLAGAGAAVVGRAPLAVRVPAPRRPAKLPSRSPAHTAT